MTGVRFQDPNLGNSSPWIYVANLWTLTACTLVIGLRLGMRRGLYGWDDALNTISSIFAIASTACIFCALRQGLGAPTDQTREASCSGAASLVVSSICLMFVAGGFSKCTTTMLTRRIITRGTVPRKFDRHLCDAITALSILWIVLAVALVASDCASSCLPSSRNSCGSSTARASAVVALSIVLELAIVGLPAWLFSRLQISRKRKLTTVVLFALRLPIIAFSAVFLYYYHPYLTEVGTSASKIGPGIYWQCGLLAYTTMVSTFQILKSKTEILSTSGAVIAGTQYGSSDRRDGFGGQSYPLKDMSRRHYNTDLDSREQLKIASVGKNDTQVLATAFANGGEYAESFGSDGSDKMIIRQQKTWQVMVE